MIKRKKTKKINIGNVSVGGDSSITVQSMCNTDTRDISSTVRQIKQLEEVGCELIRVAVLDKDAASSIKDIKKQINIPIIADIHFDYRLATEAINSGVDALRLNPGNIGNIENIKKVVTLAKQQQIPIRIGVNSGSLEKDIKALDIDEPAKLVKSAMRHIQILEDLDFDFIKVSLKSSDVLTMIKAYESIAKKIEYPLHLGVTEAGTLKSGLVKSSVGLGTLLYQGIGDTIRVSLTDEPTEEVIAGFEVLKSLRLRKKGVNLVSCPTCGRCQVDLINLAKHVESITKTIDAPITVAVMGCAVNGPGEASSADIGIAGGIGEGYIFKKGKLVKKVKEEELLEEFEKELQAFI